MLLLLLYKLEEMVACEDGDCCSRLAGSINASDFGGSFRMLSPVARWRREEN